MLLWIQPQTLSRARLASFHEALKQMLLAAPLAPALMLRQPLPAQHKHSCAHLTLVWSGTELTENPFAL